MKRLVSVATVLGLGVTTPALAQIAVPNEAGVAMGHLHYRVRDVEANARFWMRLGGERTSSGESVVIRFPGVLVFLDTGETTGGTEGSTLNHMAFRVQSLDTIAEAGFDVDRTRSSGITNVFTPEGERIELFDDTATNLGFTLDDGGINPVTQRHNRPLAVPIMSHHLHLYLIEDAVEEAQRWYTEMFGGVPGMRWRYDAVDLPGINFNFSHNPDAGGAPTQGRMLDHIGFEVENLEEYCQTLEGRGVDFDVAYHRGVDDVGRALLTDPWGVSIELTEGLRGL
ncbi:MAG: VOC family protein [Acidobacteriota bacterium]|nr:VOC family protein [Acidobacteriota bacterium]